MALRTRTRTISVPGKNGYHQFYPRTGQVVDYVKNVVTSYTSSSITDQTKSAFHQNDVVHTKLVCNPASIRTPFALSADGSHKATQFHEGLNYPSVFSQHFGEIDMDAAVAGLYADAIGSLPLQAALVVNAIELASLKTLVPNLLSGFGAVAKQMLTRRSWKELAGSHLAYQFGLVPLVADLRGILNTRSRIRKRIAQLEARNGKTCRLRYRARGSGKGEGIFSDTRGSLTINGKYSATSQLEACISADVNSFFVSNGESQCKLWSSALGLSSPLTNMWEIIPFSFVIDWFIPIGNTFLSLENRLGLHETVQSHEISNVVVSRKSRTSYRTNLTLAASAYPGWNGATVTGPSGVFTSYTRGVTSLPGIGIPSPSGWSINRTALSVSLIAQKVL